MEILGIFFLLKNNNVLGFFKYYDQFALYSCTRIVCVHAPAPMHAHRERMYVSLFVHVYVGGK